MEEAEKNGWLVTKDWNRYITTPHLDQSYLPVSSNGIISTEEILDAYYFVNSAFMKLKFTTKYGKNYILNPKFYIKKIGGRLKKQGLNNFMKLGMRLLKARFYKD